MGLAVAIVAAVLATVVVPLASAAEGPDPAKTQRERDRVRSQRAQVDLQVDALQAKDVEVQRALAKLQTNVDQQAAKLDEAERAERDARHDLADATQAVADAQRRIDDLNRQANEMVVDAFINPPSDYALDAFKADSLSDAAVKQALLEMQADTDADVLDQLAQAHEDLEVEKANRAQAAAEAADRRDAAAGALADVQAALQQQQDFADQVEERLNAKLAEAESLKQVDKNLSAKIVREQAEVAARLRAMREAAARQQAAERAAAARAAAEAGRRPPAPVPSSPAPQPNVPAPAVKSAPGGLATVTCPHGGSFLIAASIAANVQALLNAAANDGVSLCGSGWRSAERQVELRREHCGSSNYAIYYMPSSMCSPPTARPGTSMHEQGLAIDFSCNGGGAVFQGNDCWNWLVAHAASYGLYNLASEPWHWSTTGG